MAERRHWVLASAIPSTPRFGGPSMTLVFCGPVDIVAIMLNAVSPWFCIGDSEHYFGGPSMVSGFYGPIDGVVVTLNAVSP